MLSIDGKLTADYEGLDGVRVNWQLTIGQNFS